MSITNMGGDGRLYELRDSSESAVRRGQEVESFRGDKFFVTGGRAPQNEGSTGKVWVESETEGNREFFPSVVGLHWAPA